MRYMLFFFQAEDGIRDIGVTGVQTCALPILRRRSVMKRNFSTGADASLDISRKPMTPLAPVTGKTNRRPPLASGLTGKIGRASCRERVKISEGGGALKKKKVRHMITNTKHIS